MNTSKSKDQSAMLYRLFTRLLPIQVAIIAMTSVNSIIDGVVAARFIDAATVGVIGLYYTMVRILDASGSVILGGVSVLSGRYLGSGRVDKTRGITSLGLALALIIGAFLSAASLIVPGTIAGLLGSSAQLRDALCAYIRGYAIGIIPQLLGQQLASMLQLERKEKLGHIAIVVMITSNLALDLLFVVVFHMGILGLALSTAAANWAYFLVVASYYFTEQAQLRPSIKLVTWKKTLQVIQIGFPGALLIFFLAARALVLNRLLLAYSGSDGLSALSTFNMVSGLIFALSIGTGSMVRMLSSVFLGEDNRESLRILIRFCLTRVMLLMTGIAAAVIIFSSALAGLFFPDTSSQVFTLTRQLFIIHSSGLPLALLCLVFSNYYQAAGHLLFVNFLSVMDGFLSTVIPALILAPVMGAFGVWLAFLIGLFITLLCSMLYPVIRLRRVPRSLDEWMLLPEEFGSAEHLVLNLHNAEDVVHTAQLVQSFCSVHDLPEKTGYYAGLCLEEIADNIVRYGFQKDQKPHDIEVRVVLHEKTVTLRIKDDCVPFNPQELYEMTTVSNDPAKNIGIRLVYGVASHIEYQNLLGLNVLTIVLA